MGSSHCYRTCGQCSKMACRCIPRTWTLIPDMYHGHETQKAAFATIKVTMLRFQDPCRESKKLGKSFSGFSKIWQQLVLGRQNPLATDLSIFFIRNRGDLMPHFLNSPSPTSPDTLPRENILSVNYNFYKMCKYMSNCSFSSSLTQYSAEQFQMLDTFLWNK